MHAILSKITSLENKMHIAITGNLLVMKYKIMKKAL